MIIKSYLAATVAEALKQIRAELGPEAIVLKTRAHNPNESGAGRRMVEITACLENPTVGAMEAEAVRKFSPQAIAPLRDRAVTKEFHRQDRYTEGGAPKSETQKGLPSLASVREPIANPPNAQSEAMHTRLNALEQRLDQLLGLTPAHSAPSADSETLEERDFSGDTNRLEAALRATDVPERLVASLVEKLKKRLSSTPSGDNESATERLLVEEFALACAPEFTLEPGQVALFVGPSGSGKTTALGKIAVDLLFTRKQKVTLATLDDFKVAAQEEISGYAEAMGAYLIDISKSKAGALNAKRRAESILLVDSHSNINDQRQYNALVEKTRALKPDVVVLALSALTRSQDVARLVTRFRPFRPTHLIFTHTDLTSVVGGMYTAALETGLKIVGVSKNAGSMGVIATPDPAAMARTVMTEELSHAS